MMVDIQSDVSNVSRYRSDVFLSLQWPYFTIDDHSSTNYFIRSNWPRDLPGAPTVAIVRPFPHERLSSMSAYARDTVPCTPWAGPSHSTALGAEWRYIPLTTYIAGAAISWHWLSVHMTICSFIPPMLVHPWNISKSGQYHRSAS